MPIWLQHAFVVALALACAAVIVLRRVRALAGKAPSCDGCAKGCEGSEITRGAEPKEQLISADKLVRTHRSAGA